jgi:hypothetical protein
MAYFLRRKRLYASNEREDITNILSDIKKEIKRPETKLKRKKPKSIKSRRVKKLKTKRHIARRRKK